MTDQGNSDPLGTEERNVERDVENENALEELGWQVLTVWECDLNDDPVEAVEELMTELDAQLEE